jgi:hypothetical protein
MPIVRRRVHDAARWESVFLRRGSASLLDHDEA